MSIFSSYEKMPDAVAAWGLEPSGFRALKRARWIATEKIHGANFCFVTDGATVQCANRRQLLEDGEPFFGYETVRDRWHDAVLQTFAEVRAAHSDVSRILIYGELFGGGYPHLNVPPIPGIQPIQTGVWYAPDIHFCAFDLRLKLGRNPNRYMDYEIVMAILTRTGIPFAVPLFTGGYEAALNFPIAFDSTIPQILGLPPLPAGTNPAEGVVLKPLREIAVTGAKGPVRPILKRKIPTFAEDRRFHEAEKWTAPPPAAGNLDLLKWEVYNRVVENRVDTAVSKIGSIRPEHSWAGALFTFLQKEVLEEASAAEPDAYAALTSAQQQQLNYYIMEQVGAILKGRFGAKR